MDMNSSVLITAASLADVPDFTVGFAHVSPSTRTVSGPGGKAQAEPRVMQVLIVLADAAGTVVTRETLLERCWGGVYVGDDSLNRAIAGVRRLAAGIAANSFEIETIPRTGYRLLTRAEPAEESDIRSALAETTSGPSARSFARRRVLAGGLAAAAALGIWLARKPAVDPAEPLIEASRAVMRSGTPQGQRRAIALLEQAVRQVPDSAAAWGLLALTRARIDEHNTAPTTPQAARIEEAARTALRLDPNNADASAALAVAVPYYGDWLAAERRFDAVLARHPDQLFVKDSRAFLLGAVGRMRESARYRLSFSSEDAFDPDLRTREIYAYWFLDRIAEADRAAHRGLAMWPRHAGIWFGRLWVLAGTGRFDRALAHIDDEAQRPALPPPMVATLRSAMVAAKTGAPADIAAASRQVMTGVERSVAAVVNAMMLLNLMKQTDTAFSLAQAYYLEQGPIIAAVDWRPGQPLVPDQRRRKTNMLFTPTAAAMQRDPRFLPLMQDMGLVNYWRQRGVRPDFLQAG